MNIPCDCMFPKLCDDCRGSGYVICTRCDSRLATHEDDACEPVCYDCHPMPDRCLICERRLTLDTRSREPRLCKWCEGTARVAGKQATDAARYPEES